jgi:hypoxanthine phosphoribosyltransferase
MSQPTDRPIAVLFSDQEIAARIDVLAAEIATTMGAEALVVTILKGSFVFAADLMRALHRAGMRLEVDFLTLSSYGTGTTSSGRAEVVRDMIEPVAGRNVLLIDDILESGRTLAAARALLLERGAAEVRPCLLLEKRGKRTCEIEADFVGFVCPDRFVVGYGLDYAHAYRELPFIGTLADL